MASSYGGYGYGPYGYGYGGVPYPNFSYIPSPYLPSYPVQGRFTPNPMYSSLAPTPFSLSQSDNTPLGNLSERQHLSSTSSAPVTNSQQPIFNRTSPVTHFVDGRSFPRNHGVGETTGPLMSEKPGLLYGVVDSPSPQFPQPLPLPLNLNELKGSGVSSLCDEPKSGSIGNGNAQSPSEDVQGNKKKKDEDDFLSKACYSRVSSMVNAMCSISNVLVHECFNNGSCLKIDQLEKLDNVVDNISKCLKKITSSNKTEEAREASLPTRQSMDVAKDFKGSSLNSLASLGFIEAVDDNEIAQSIKNILTFKFLDGEEHNPQTLLYKKLWIETEAAFFSTTCMARYHRIKNEIGSLKFHNKEISADTSTFVQEPSLNLQKSVQIMNNAEKEITEALIKNGSNCENNALTKSNDAEPVEAVVSHISSNESTAGKEPNDDVKDRFQESAHENNIEDLEINRYGKCRRMSDVMRVFQMMKRRKAEQLEKSLNNNSDIDSNSNSDSDSDSESSGSIAGNGEEESSKSDWEDVLLDFESRSAEESSV